MVPAEVYRLYELVAVAQFYRVSVVVDVYDEVGLFDYQGVAEIVRAACIGG